MQLLLDTARAEQCSEAWVLTDRSNKAAIGLYESVGGEEDPRSQTIMFSFALAGDSE